jgi:hypothetical protein
MSLPPPRKAKCIACSGTGKSSKGRVCVPCNGTGRPVGQQDFALGDTRSMAPKPETFGAASLIPVQPVLKEAIADSRPQKPPPRKLKGRVQLTMQRADGSIVTTCGTTTELLEKRIAELKVIYRSTEGQHLWSIKQL